MTELAALRTKLFTAFIVAACIFSFIFCLSWSSIITDPGIPKLDSKYSAAVAAAPFMNFSQSEGKTARQFWKSLKPSFKCPTRLKSRVGRGGDGGKWMCGLATLGRQSIVEGYNCIVYSFGVSGDSSFEAEVLATTTCSVYAYDPAVGKIGKPVKSSNPRLHFQRLGIAGMDSEGNRMLKSLMTENGHKFLDILKMDLEGAEYESLERMLEDFDELPFGQLLLELHISNETWALGGANKVIGLLERVERRGARVFNVEPNDLAIDCCAEFSLINLKHVKLYIPEK